MAPPSTLVWALLVAHRTAAHGAPPRLQPLLPHPCRAAQQAAKARRAARDLASRARRLTEYQAQLAVDSEQRVRTPACLGLAAGRAGGQVPALARLQTSAWLHLSRDSGWRPLFPVTPPLTAMLCTLPLLHPPQLAAKAERLKREQLRCEVLDVARAERRHRLLRQSAGWVTPQTLDARISEALDNPVPLHADG